MMRRSRREILLSASVALNGARSRGKNAGADVNANREDGSWSWGSYLGDGKVEVEGGGTVVSDVKASLDENGLVWKKPIPTLRGREEAVAIVGFDNTNERNVSWGETLISKAPLVTTMFCRLC